MVADSDFELEREKSVKKRSLRMALAKRVSERENEAEILEFFTAEDVQHNLTFLMLADSMLKKYANSKQDIIKVIDPEDDNNILYYTNDKFLEVIDLYGLDGFIY